MSITSEKQLPEAVAAWRDQKWTRLKEPDPQGSNKGYIALLGWSVNAIKAAQKFDRRYVVVAPEWAEDFCTANNIPLYPGILSA